MRVAQAND